MELRCSSVRLEKAAAEHFNGTKGTLLFALLSKGQLPWGGTFSLAVVSVFLYLLFVCLFVSLWPSLVSVTAAFCFVCFWFYIILVFA